MKMENKVRSRRQPLIANGLGKVFARAVFAGAVLVGSAAADPKSDLFQPDVLGTGRALRNRTPGLMDPRGHDCPVPAGSLTLPVAVNLALCRNPATRSAWATARQQAAAMGISESEWLPTISASGDEIRDFGLHTDVNGQFVSTDQNTRDAALNLSWLLYDFGGREAKVHGATLLLNSAADSLGRTAQQTVFNVVQTFYGVVAANASVVAAKSAEIAYARSVEIATALQKGGAASLADVLQAETAYDQSILARVQAEYQSQAAAGTLAVTIGAPADQSLKLEAESVPDEVPALTARMQELMKTAERQRPDLAAARAQRDAAAANVTVARAVGRPSISLQASHIYSDTTSVPSLNYNQIGIYVTVPIFTGFNVAYSVRQAQAALENSEVNVDQIRLNISSDVWNGYYSLSSANQQLGASATLVKTADQNQQVALGRYKAGVGTILDLLTAQAAAASAAQTRITAELNWEVSRAQLTLAIGRLSGSEPLTDQALP